VVSDLLIALALGQKLKDLESVQCHRCGS
jgi:hypothetical protein